MKTLVINNPIWVKDGYCYISVTDYNFRKLANRWGELEVEVFKDGIFQGRNIIVRKVWTKNCELKEKKPYYYPDKPMTWYYKRMKLLTLPKKQTEDEKLKLFSAQCL